MRGGTKGWLWPALIAAVLIGAVLSVGVGSAAIPPARALAALLGRGDPVERAILVELRLPRAILGLAIGAEVAATLALKAADGLTRPGPTLIVAVGYGTALWLMSTSMDMLPIGVVYAIWSGVGMIGAAIGGAWLYGEAVSPTMLVGIAVIAVGVTILAAGQGQH